MYVSEKTRREAEEVAAEIGWTVAQVLANWEREANFEARAEAAQRQQFMLDDA